MYKASEKRGSEGPQRAKCSQIFRMQRYSGGQGGPRKTAAASVSVAIHKSTWMARSLFSQLDDFSLVHRLEAWKRRKASEKRGSEGPQRAKCSQIFRMQRYSNYVPYFEGTRSEEDSTRKGSEM